MEKYLGIGIFLTFGGMIPTLVLAGVSSFSRLQEQSMEEQTAQCAFVAEVEIHTFKEDKETRERSSREFDDAGETVTEKQQKIVAEASIVKILKSPKKLDIKINQTVHVVFWKHISGKNGSSFRTASEQPPPGLGKATLLILEAKAISKANGIFELPPTFLWPSKNK